jgi:outer membrane autotransporter protein
MGIGLVSGGKVARLFTFTPALLRITALTGIRAPPGLAGAILAAAITVSTAYADDWNGTVSSDWFTGGNWADGTVPTATDIVILDAVTPHTPMVDSGAASAWRLFVGDFSAGALTIKNGGVVGDTLGVLGYDARGTGTATITGTGSTWSNSGLLSIGDSGAGTLIVEHGGAVENTNGTIGHIGGATGIVTVTGSGSTWTNSGYLFVGEHGTGTLSIENGGSVSVNGIAAVGRGSSGIGTATVTGTGSTWTINDFFLVGNLTGSQGSLTVKDGGTIISNGQVRIGEAAGTQGTALVTGADSKWVAAPDQFHVGFWGRGSLTIADGGKVSGARLPTIGTWGGSAGVVKVTGAGSIWNNAGDLHIGDRGSGGLTIEDGGAVANGIGYVGYHTGAAGTVLVTGNGSTWTNGGFLSIGAQGTGSLMITGGARVTSVGAFVGHFTGGQGDVTVTGPGVRWDTSASLMVGYQSEGKLTVADGAVVSSTGAVVLATFAGSQGIVNIGAAAGEAPAAPGTLEAAQVSFGDGDGRIVFNHTESSYLFSPTITGNGRIDVLAGTTALGDASRFSGTTTVNSSATLIVNQTLGGTLDVLTSGTLKGSGTVGATNVAGTVAPGNSIGTLHVAGNYIQAAGSTYEVEVNAAGDSDRIEVAGIAALNGGTVKVLPFPDFALATPYTILSATGGVTGAFADLSGGFASAFLTPHLTYDANHAFFAITQTASFESAALTPNQRAAAAGADSTGPGNVVWNAIAMLPSADEAPAAFDSLSGEVHASAKSMLIDDSRFVREAAIGRLRAASAAVGAEAAPVLAYGDAGPQPALPTTKRFAVWGRAFGSWGQWDGDGNAAALDRNTGGFFLGGDMAVTESWRAGLLAGYSRSRFNVEDRASSGTADNYHLGVYAGTAIGNLGIRFGAAYSWHEIETRRAVAFRGYTDNLSADYRAATAQLFGQIGYRIDTRLASFEPFADLAYVNLHTDGFTENGGGAALTAASSTQDSPFTTLGLRAETALPVGSAAARVHGTLGWRHAFGDVAPSAGLAFLGGSVFSVTGAPIAKDAAVIEAGLNLNISADARLGIAYDGQIGDGASGHGFHAAFSAQF